jgi:hypothetical protein
MAAHCHAGLGRLHRRLGDKSRGKQHREVAAGMYRDMNMQWWAGVLDADTVVMKAALPRAGPRAGSRN